MILAGDIGGTHTRLALFENGQIVGEEKKYPSHQYTNLEDIVLEFLQKEQVPKACFGIAGAVRGGVCKATNLPWIIDSKRLSQVLNIPSVYLLNDLEANAYGLRVLQKQDLYLLHEGQEQKGNQALIAAGTGLGEAVLFWNGKEHHPFACEGGHTDFAPRNAIEIELFLYLRKKFEHVSYERVASGPGLISIFQFLIETGREKESLSVKEEMGKRNPSRVITEWGSKDKDPACAHALELFLSLYGAEAGNMALKFLSLGGFYIGGGIAPNLIEKLKSSSFHSSFIDKGRFKDLLDSIPIRVIVNDNAALLGTAYYAENR